MAAKVGPATVSYGIGVQNRYSAFLDDDDGFVTSASLVANSKRIASELNKQKSGVVIASSRPNNQSSHNNPSGGRSGKASSKSAGSNKQSDSKGSQQHEPKRNEMIKRGQQQKQPGVVNLSANNSVQAAQKQPAVQQNSVGNTNKYQGAQNGINNNRHSRTTQFSGLDKMQANSKHHQSSASHSSMNMENNDAGQQHHGKPFRQNNQRAITKRSNDERKIQPLQDDPTVAAIGQSNEEEKRRRQQKRTLDMKHKDPEKREAKRQQSNQVAQSQSTFEGAAADSASSPANQGPIRGGRGRRQLQDGERHPSNEMGRNQGGAGMRNRGRRLEGEGGGERRDNNNRGPRADRPQRNRNGFGAGSRGSRGSRGDDQGKFSSEKQRPIPNFSDKSDFPSLAS